MAALKILKNVYQYAVIMCQSVTEEVSNWDIASLRNSIKWADYAQNISSHVRGSPFEKDMEYKLSEMALLIRPLTCFSLTLDNLAKSKEILIENLLHNKNLTQEMKGELTKLMQQDSLNGDLLEQVIAKMNSLTEEKVVMDLLLDELSSAKGSSSRSHMEQEILTSRRETSQYHHQAHVLIKHLLTVCRQPDNDGRIEEYIAMTLDHTVEKGWNLPSALIYEAKQAEREGEIACERIAGCIRIWLNESLHNWPLESPLCTSDAGLLCLAANHSSDFLALYLEALTLWADCFHPVFDLHLSWKSPAGATVQDFSEHFSNLLHVHSQARTQALDILKDQIRHSEFSLWSDVGRNLLLRLKKG